MNPSPLPIPVPPPPGGPLPSDAEVVRRVVGGEASLFEVLMRRHNPLVYRTLRGILRDEAEVEDAMQAAWLGAYAGLPGFQGGAAFSTWLARIAINEGLMRLRATGRVELVEDAPVDEEAAMTSERENPERKAADREAIGLVEDAVDALPAPYRTVFMLREVEEMPTAEVAACLGITEEAVRVRLHRARLGIRDSLLARVRTSAREAFPFLAPRCNRLVEAVMGRILGAL
ncbi:MAG: RNA polymerase sigma factor [Anaeromyxobacteraceae bacterium]